MAAVVYISPGEWDWDQQDPVSKPKGTVRLNRERTRSLSTRTAVNYGYEVGLHRLLDVLDERDLY